VAPANSPKRACRRGSATATSSTSIARWSNCILVFDKAGNLKESWTQWDSMLQRPHFVAISPYDAEKNVWIIDDHKHVIHKFTHDGKKELLTVGTYGVPGNDGTHFNRPTYMDWFANGDFVVADGYNGTRVAMFDKNGKFIRAWGEKGQNQNDTRGGYFNNVHGISIDPKTERIFVNDRGNHRVQVFDKTGKFLDQWRFGDNPSDVHLFHIMSDGYLWAADRGTNKMLKYDLNGHFMYSWGRGVTSRAACGARTASASIPRATSTWPKWTTAARTNTRRAKAPIRRIW
jgi:6-phosphogluconolactonase (cycloisomerase 2 family)